MLAATTLQQLLTTLQKPLANLGRKVKLLEAAAAFQSRLRMGEATQTVSSGGERRRRRSATNFVLRLQGGQGQIPPTLGVWGLKWANLIANQIQLIAAKGLGKGGIPSRRVVPRLQASYLQLWEQQRNQCRGAPPFAPRPPRSSRHSSPPCQHVDTSHTHKKSAHCLTNPIARCRLSVMYVVIRCDASLVMDGLVGDCGGPEKSRLALR